MSIDQAAAQPAGWSVMWGIGIDLCVTVCLTVGLLGSGRMSLCFHLCAAVGTCVRAYVCVHTGLIGLSITACPGNQ